ncbi:MAG TPA: hypothetical protein VKT28_05400 [Puia sp.]|nr:hypothetical protein [Puia sp.]
MAKSAKKAVKKTAKKTAKKVAKKAPKKVAKKTVKKAAKKSAPKAPAKKRGKKFLIIYHAPFEAMAQMASIPPEQQAAGMALWQAWIDRIGDSLVDVGAPLINGKSLRASGSSSPSEKEVSGYSLIIAENLDEVMNLLESHPHLSGWHPEATIEIHETMLLPGM